MFKELKLSFADSWGLFKSNFFSLCALTLPFWVLQELIFSFQETNQWMWISLILFTLTGALYQGAIIMFTFSRMKNIYISPIQSYQIAFKFFIPLLIIQLLVAIPTALGTLALIIPGIYLYARFSFSLIYCMIGKERPIASIEKSWRKTESKVWILFWGYFIIISTITISNTIFMSILGLPEKDTFSFGSLPLSFLTSTFGSILNIFTVHIFLKISE